MRTTGLRVLLAVLLVALACSKPQERVQQGEAIRGTEQVTPAPLDRQQPDAGAGAQKQAVATLDATPCPPQLGEKAKPANASVVLSAPKAVFERNETVPLRLTLTNTGPADLRRRWGSAQPDYDVWVVFNGKVVWRSFFDAETRGAAGDRTYAAGEKRVIDEPWPNVYCSGAGKQQRDRVPGTYIAQGYFADFEGGWYSNPFRFEIR